MKHSHSLRRALAGALLALSTLCAAACGSNAGTGTAAAVTVAPAAYGVQAGKAFDCYYLESTTEVSDLIDAGLCPRGSVATPMPLTWEETYWGYYDSPAYYDTYMPVSYRKTFTTVYVVHFSHTYSTQITADKAQGTYKTSTGKTIKGGSVAALKYGTGTTSRTVHGGGSGTVGSCALSWTALQDKGSSSTSHGGGSGTRSGTTTGKSTGKTSTSSGSHGGC